MRLKSSPIHLLNKLYKFIVLLDKTKLTSLQINIDIMNVLDEMVRRGEQTVRLL